MKKLWVLLFVAVLTPSVFAGQNRASVFEKAVEQAAVAAVAAREGEVADAQAKLQHSLQLFAQAAYKHHYADYSFMFQALDPVRKAYLNLRALSEQAAREALQQVNQPVRINEGKNQLVIADYVRMEACVLGSFSQKEEALWNEWSRLLDEDAKTVTVEMEKDLPPFFASRLQALRLSVGKAQNINPSSLLQSIAGLMDEFNANKQDQTAARNMARAFVKPLKTGWGRELDPVAFIRDHACELYGQAQYDLENFADEVQRLSR